MLPSYNENVDKMTATEKEVMNLIQVRQRLGRKRYGRGIHFTHYRTAGRWVKEALDEALDLVQYLTALKLFLKTGGKDATKTKYTIKHRANQKAS